MSKKTEEVKSFVKGVLIGIIIILAFYQLGQSAAWTVQYIDAKIVTEKELEAELCNQDEETYWSGRWDKCFSYNDRIIFWNE